MNQRNLFKMIGGAMCAASMELTGVRPKLFLIDETPDVSITKAVLPEGMGFSWDNVVYTRHLNGYEKAFIPFSGSTVINGEWVEVRTELSSSTEGRTTVGSKSCLR